MIKKIKKDIKKDKKVKKSTKEKTGSNRLKIIYATNL